MIELGRGSTTCYIGQKANELMDDRTPTAIESGAIWMGRQTELTFQKDGYVVWVEKDRVRSIDYYFIHDSFYEFNPFRGKTSKGINAQSTIYDVIHTYGQPASLSNTTIGDYGSSDWIGAEKVGLGYAKLGIEFVFMNEKLYSITVFTPPKIIDPFVWSDTGNTSKYRAIKPRRGEGLGSGLDL